MNENFEKYIEGLSPELQEKARACKTKEELNAFIAENDLELPEEALEVVAGGCGTSTPPTPDKCNKCNAKVKQCTDADLMDITTYDFKRWRAPKEDSGSGLFSKIKNINPFPQQVAIDISAHFHCPNCGIVYKDEIHA